MSGNQCNVMRTTAPSCRCRLLVGKCSIPLIISSALSAFTACANTFLHKTHWRKVGEKQRKKPRQPSDSTCARQQDYGKQQANEQRNNKSTTNRNESTRVTLTESRWLHQPSIAVDLASRASRCSASAHPNLIYNKDIAMMQRQERKKQSQQSKYTRPGKLWIVECDTNTKAAR